MKTRLVTTLREFDALAPLWRDVTQESSQTSPFLSHDWFACCWRNAGPKRRREVMLFEDAAGPLALFPLMSWKTNRRGLPIRMLGFLESPETPFHDVPIAGDVQPAIDLFLRTLRARDDWDLLYFAKLPAHSEVFKALTSALADTDRWSIPYRNLTPCLSVGGTWEEFVQTRPRLGQCCRELQTGIGGKGTLTVESHTQVDVEGPIFTDFLETLSQDWTQARRALAIPDSAQRFFRELTERASANEWLRLWLLRLDGRPISSEYQIAAGESAHVVRAAYDPTLAHLSPALCLRGSIVPSLFQSSGVREYYMGPGHIDSKRDWATGKFETFGLKLYARTPYGRFLHRLETRLLPLARRWGLPSPRS